MSKVLKLYSSYTRKQVHDILAPHEPFTAGAGKWGLHGILPIPGKSGDFVFFASLGQSTGGHTFDEGISSEGILRWQSQPKQKLENPTILSLINHDDFVNDIHFFLRTSNLKKGKAQPYTYLGPLRYLLHDDQREQPVHFAWELLHWPIPEKVRSSMGLALDLEEARPIKKTKHQQKPSGLVRIPKPQGRPLGEPTRTFQARKARRMSEHESRALGLAGEQLVLDYETRRLVEAGRPDLAKKIEHVSFEQGDGAGYDIKSYNLDGSELYIEVKTTTGAADTAFYISSNEVEFSRKNSTSFVIYRLANYDSISKSAVFYDIYGCVEVSCSMIPTTYRARIL